MILIEASPDRVERACAYVDRCGGCPLMHDAARAQAEAKLATVVRALAKVPRAGPPGDVSIAITSPDARLGYRKRARLAWKRSGVGASGRWLLGFRMRRDERIADVERCVVLRPELDAILAIVRARVAPHLAGEGELQLALGEGGRPVIVIDTADAPPRALF